MQVQWVVVLLAVAVAALSISPTLGAPRRQKGQRAAPECESYTDCGDCTSEPLCGWCDVGSAAAGKRGADGADPSLRAGNRFARNRVDNSYCSEGTANGPTGATCPGLWQHDDCTDEEECNVRETCGRCLDPELPQVCGWCDTRCVSGDEAGPLDTEVECSDYLFPPDSCASVDCSAFLECGVCASSSFCGWCSNSTLPGGKECMPGGPGGPSDPLACSAEEWHSNEGECRPPPDACDYAGCAPCLGAESEECVWCASQSLCLEADSYYAEECLDLRTSSCDESCEDFQFCNNCVQDSACGWCTSDLGEGCVGGDLAGPYFNASKCDTYSYESCPTCSTLETCTDCFTNLNCEWCFVNQSDQVTGVCLDVGLPGDDKRCLNGTVECSSPLPSATPSVSFSPSSTISRTPVPSKSLSMLPSNSTSATITPSNSTTASATPEPSVSLSASVSATRQSMSVSGSISLSPSASESAAMSITPSVSLSASVSISATTSISRTPSRSTTATETLSITPSKSLTSSATSSRPPSVTRTPTPTKVAVATTESSVVSSGESSEYVPPAPASEGVNWAIWGPVIGISVLLIIALVAVGAYLFYTKYWKKRWYYMKLK